MFIKLTVAHFLTLKRYCFWTFRSRYVKIVNLTQTKMLPNPVLLLFPDSCFDQAGRSLEEKKEEIKFMSPTLIDEPLCKTGINQRCTCFFLGKRVTCLSAFAPWKRKPCQYYLSSWNPFFVELSHQGQILKLIEKHAAKSWIPTSHPVHLQLLDSCLDLEGC